MVVAATCMATASVLQTLLYLRIDSVDTAEQIFTKL